MRLKKPAESTLIAYAKKIGEKRNPLLAEREKTHGDFGANAYISQKLKGIFRQEGGQDLPNVPREALDMIALKLSRILSGRWSEADHWKDIAGYANLVVESLDK